MLSLVREVSLVFGFHGLIFLTRLVLVRHGRNLNLDLAVLFFDYFLVADHRFSSFSFLDGNKF